MTSPRPQSQMLRTRITIGGQDYKFENSPAKRSRRFRKWNQLEFLTTQNRSLVQRRVFAQRQKGAFDIAIRKQLIEDDLYQRRERIQKEKSRQKYRSELAKTQLESTKRANANQIKLESLQNNAKRFQSADNKESHNSSQTRFDLIQSNTPSKAGRRFYRLEYLRNVKQAYSASSSRKRRKSMTLIKSSIYGLSRFQILLKKGALLKMTSRLPLIKTKRTFKTARPPPLRKMSTTRKASLSSPSTASSSIIATPKAAPFVTASNWSIFDSTTGTLVAGKDEHTWREIASMTKIMTWYCVIKLMQMYNCIRLDTPLTVTQYASSRWGTSAELVEGEQVTTLDLLYGLMLPSGNDAAWVLAISFGEFLASFKEDPLEPIYEFIAFMNVTAEKLGLNNTNFHSPHGLPHKENQSCAFDVGKLAWFAYQIEQIRDIVATKIHYCYVKSPQGSQYDYRMAKWENTNKLLGKEFDGIKTGITPTAGPCLCASYKKKRCRLIVVIMNSKQPDHRWSEVDALVKWAEQRFI